MALVNVQLFAIKIDDGYVGPILRAHGSDGGAMEAPPCELIEPLHTTCLQLRSTLSGPNFRKFS